MNDKELLKVCCIEPTKLQRYIQSGILNKHDINENDICLITTLESIGFSISMIKVYMDNYHDHNNESCLQMLQKQRNTILNNIHDIQKNVDSINELMIQIKEDA
ncbi:MAG: hypothetical protein LUG60_11225 [Erysipelotrichaceae bacterium]|nr:hypothetical protein [Erysipelotrichaceae bacterium]